MGLADIQHPAPRGEDALLSVLKRIPPTEIPFGKMVIARRDVARRRTGLTLDGAAASVISFVFLAMRLEKEP